MTSEVRPESPPTLDTSTSTRPYVCDLFPNSRSASELITSPYLVPLPQVKGYAAENLKDALTGAEIILIPAGVPRKPGMTRDDLFNTNASIVRDLAKAAAETAPKALVGIISNPVNSTVPIWAEVYKPAGVYDPKRLFGVTTLDVVRASRFLSEIQGTDPKDTKVTVV
jgi:malate dehydrogenase